ncbi:DUF4886 domain-containing protein [Acholeplasma vituli]|uniref:DUF4886 domain-containing protein n=1 Tax=Paracholeplasma vituli TaxID=69473 RepID=A0ABT2PX33_9MOLU|nr:DUF4886 domain-containing protein [Paracholeplasma vituli]MCU0105516.1 DUF4886 domain-containing protein [Paracholeplasma vituli]
MRRFTYALVGLLMVLSLAACVTSPSDPVKFTVAFESNGGLAIDSIEVEKDTLMAKPTDPTRDGYTFAGWFKESSLTTPWQFASDKVTGNIKLYAKWTPIPGKFLVVFDSDFGTPYEPVLVTAGSVLTEPETPVKEGYIFDGWYTDLSYTTEWDFTDVVNNNLTLYAKWNLIKPVVTFDTEGGSEVDSIVASRGRTIARPEDPVKAGFVFAGWFMDEAYENLFNFETEVVMEDITLYAKWASETNFNQTFKVLSIGNSFSEDAHRYLWSIAQSYGVAVENIVIANMYIGGAELALHVTNLTNDANAYTYQYYEGATMQTLNGVKLSQAIRAERWDVVTFQQASHFSGMAANYADHVETLTNFVLDNASNPNVQILWHMTWAYQQNSTHSGFNNYDKNQMTMYEAIVDATLKKITPLSQVMTVIPSGTAIQNARTSYLGDMLTRDGYHLSDPLGRYIAALMFFKSITGFTLNKETIFRPTGVSALLQEMAIEAVNNAYMKPYEVTNSTFTTEPEPEPIPVNGVLYPFEFVLRFLGR